MPADDQFDLVEFALDRPGHALDELGAAGRRRKIEPRSGADSFWSGIAEPVPDFRNFPSRRFWLGDLCRCDRRGRRSCPDRRCLNRGLLGLGFLGTGCLRNGCFGAHLLGTGLLGLGFLGRDFLGARFFGGHFPDCGLFRAGFFRSDRHCSDFSHTGSFGSGRLAGWFVVGHRRCLHRRKWRPPDARRHSTNHRSKIDQVRKNTNQIRPMTTIAKPVLAARSVSTD